MDIAIVAPCPIPYVIGGAENLWRGLQDHINAHTPHQAELIKLPTPELTFWELVDSYRRFAELDLTGFDLVISSKYPAWMVSHPRHVVYMLHKLRGLYDTYHFLQLPDRHPTEVAPVQELRAFMAARSGDRAALEEFFGRLEELRGAAGLPDDLFAFPGSFIREVVHWLDDIGLASSAIHGYGAIADAVRQRPDHFPPDRDVFVGHPPTGLRGLHEGRGKYLFTASRLDNAKRVGLIVEAMAHVKRDVELRIAGGGPLDEHLRAQAADDPRITFCGRVSDAALVDLYAGAKAVVFVPYFEDYGYITLEAMLSGKPVITCTDSGGTTELVRDGVTGLVVEPSAEALGAAIDSLWGDRRAIKRMGAAGLEAGQRVSWDAVLKDLLA
ncbi:glycosyltransferase family 4 protein [Solirubrobacter phytolaccae]|uniref:Glycosyltransferase family 4 protein n=1 Tax=Solirubrobacter phytolaccae TaxID=1404360 RepID=A0A9X3SCD3_9ACTN|nr:glycosyltransferase family 4 protein [Solirubrobacter phytolaccae]MDA0182390.1 glycosyltransferase family 4 protein [Solirubrobacter phytolaccae]